MPYPARVDVKKFRLTFMDFMPAGGLTLRYSSIAKLLLADPGMSRAEIG